VALEDRQQQTRVAEAGGKWIDDRGGCRAERQKSVELLNGARDVECVSRRRDRSEHVQQRLREIGDDNHGRCIG
jgi:hypothetical protein